MKLPVLVLLTVLAAVGITLLLRFLPEGGVESGPFGTTDAEQAPAGAAEAEPETAPLTADAPDEASLTVADEPSDSRTPIPSRLVGFVRSESGGPLVDAEVGGRPEETTTRSGAEGRFTLDPTPLVAATHPDHLAAGVAADEAGPAPEIVLAPAAPVEALVLDAEGDPVPGAIVESRGTVPIGGVDLPVRREVSAADDGRARIAPLPGRSRLQARHEDRLSEIWVGEHTRLAHPVVLTLGATFQAGGRVVGAPSAEALSLATVRVRRARAEDVWNRPRDDWRRHAASTKPASDGTWTLDPIPWSGPGTYLFRLEGPGTIAVEIAREIASPDDLIGVDLEWTAGNPLSFVVVDPDGDGLHDVELVACWREGTDWKRTAIRTAEDGRAEFDAVPANSIWVRATKDGFGNTTFGAYTPPGDVGEFTVTLAPAARVVGVCTFQGEPVEDFTVTYWGADPAGRSTRTFAGRADGSFTLDDAPSGELHLLAHSAARPASASVDLEVAPGAEVEVALELPTGVVARGRVIDARDGQPIAGASLQVHNQFGGRPLEPWGAPHGTDARGEFDSVAISPTNSQIDVTANGYETEHVSPTGDDGGELDLGLVSLFPSGRVTIQLVSDTITDFSEFQGTLWGRTGVVPASADGRLVFEDQGPGSRLLLVHTPERNRIDTTLDLDPSGGWDFRVSVGTPRTVVVRLVPSAGVEVPIDAYLSAEHIDLTGTPSRCLVQFDEDRLATLDFVVGNQLMLSCVRTSGEVIAARWATIEDAPRVELDLPLTGETRTLRLVDAEDEPIANAIVGLVDPERPYDANVEYYSSLDGLIQLQSVTVNPVAIRGRAGSANFATQMLDLESEEDPLVVRIDTTARVRARLLERNEPAVAVPTRLYEAGHWTTHLADTSDADGLVEFAQLSPTVWDLGVVGGGWWPMRVPLTARAEGEPDEVQVRRMGTLDVRVQRDGLPVAGASVALTYPELKGNVADWLDEGRATAGESGLVTDLAGEVRLSGIPNGAYAWTVTLSDGSTREGPCMVAALESSLLTVEF